MSEISRGDLDRLYDGIDDVRKAVTQSELRLGARIDAQRVENDKTYVRSADLQLVAKDLANLAGVVNTELGRRTWNRQTIILAALAFLGNLAIAVFNLIALALR